MWLIVIFGLATLASYGGMPQPAAGGVRMISIVGLIFSIVVVVRNFIKSKMELRKKNRRHSSLQSKSRQRTPKELAIMPFWERAGARNGHYRNAYSQVDGYLCAICGKSQYRNDTWCSMCQERYKNDVANGWRPDPKDHIKKGYEWVLWRLQQIVARDLQMHIISEEAARAEMKEVVGVARQEIAEMEREKARNETEIQQRIAQQTELSNIVKRLS